MFNECTNWLTHTADDPALLFVQNSLIRKHDATVSCHSSMRKEPWMRTSLLLTLTIAMLASSSALAQQSSYRNTRIQPRPVPPEQQLDLPPARIQLQSPTPSRVAVVQPNVTNNVLPQTQVEPAPVATPAPAVTPAPAAAPAVTATPAPAPTATATPTPAATADEPVVEGTVAQQPATQQPVRYYRPQQQPQQRQGFFGRLMQVERRKNAWLRRTFLQ
jgi:hypothetical protein